jgi:dienelactone hydrolase
MDVKAKQRLSYQRRLLLLAGLAAVMRDFSGIDRNNLGAIGYSVGGVAALNLITRNNDVDALVTLDPTFGVTPFIKLATESPYYHPTRMGVSWLYLYRVEPATMMP